MSAQKGFRRCVTYAWLPSQTDIIYRFLHVPGVPIDPPPPKASLDDADIIPEAHANFLDLVTFGWMNPLLGLGYARPLEATDLYRLQDSRSSQVIADKILASFDRRQDAANEYNARLAAGEIKPGWRALWWRLKGSHDAREKQWRQKDGRKRASLALAMNDSIAWWYWSGGILKLTSDVSSMLSPLVVKVRHLLTPIIHIHWYLGPYTTISHSCFRVSTVDRVRNVCVHARLRIQSTVRYWTCLSSCRRDLPVIYGRRDRHRGLGPDRLCHALPTSFDIVRASN